MKIIAAFCVLLAVCYAQDPPQKPTIPETFIAKNITVRRRNHEHGDHMGHGYFERFFNPTMGTEEFDVKFMTAKGIYEERNIVRYDTKMDYFIRVENSGTPMCNETMLHNNMYEMWTWVNNAHGYKCDHKPEDAQYYCWENHRNGIMEILVVDEVNLKIPVALIIRDSRKGIEDDIRFNGMFEAATPPKKDFEPPASCKQ